MGTKVRSTLQWLEEGEKLTRFFFHLEKECNEKYEIISVGNSQGVKVPSSAAIKQLRMDFNGNLFAVENIDLVSQQWLFTNVKAKSSDLNHNQCAGAITLAKISAVVRPLSLKCPGPDGFSLEYYLHFWNLLVLLFVSVYNDSLKRSSLSESMRSNVTRLLYTKKGHITELKNWHPIPLLNVDYNIISKVLTLHLSHVMACLVDPHQTCSATGRLISSNLILLRDALVIDIKLVLSSVGL